MPGHIIQYLEKEMEKQIKTEHFQTNLMILNEKDTKYNKYGPDLTPEMMPVCTVL